MRSILPKTLLIIAMTGVLAVAQDDKAEEKKPNNGVAAVTTYTPTVGDKLEFDIRGTDGELAKQRVSVASISSDGKLVRLDVTIYKETADKKEQVLVNAEATWTSKDDFMKPVKGLLYTRKSYIVGNKSIACYVFVIEKSPTEKSEIWVAAVQKHTIFPGLVLYKENGRVMLRLNKITHKAH